MSAALSRQGSARALNRYGLGRRQPGLAIVLGLDSIGHGEQPSGTPFLINLRQQQPPISSPQRTGAQAPEGVCAPVKEALFVKTERGKTGLAKKQPLTTRSAKKAARSPGLFSFGCGPSEAGTTRRAQHWRSVDIVGDHADERRSERSPQVLDELCARPTLLATTPATLPDFHGSAT